MRFIIYVDDHPPTHVHAEGKDGAAKIAIDGARLIWNRGLSRGDVKTARDGVEMQSRNLYDAWTKLHG